MKSKVLWMALLLAPAGALAAPQAHAASTMKCTMHFTLSGWSAVYQTASGNGTVTCANGKSMKVKINAKGGGLSVGKYKIDDGKGKFTHVKKISDVIGAYATANAHAGVVGSGHAAAMTKGPVSLALSGHGKGWDIGAGFESFSIKRAH